ncbi:MAG: hypothetical protein QNJ06_03190, partial [Kiloniellales bacterium]|nr:hypothetical protein [Kiloniellales bacterium]
MAEGLSPAENGPAPAVRQAPSDLAAPRPSLYRIEVPPAGRRRIYPIYPQLFISLSFDLALPAVGRRGDDMVLGFDNGGEVVLQGFVGIAETCPTLHLLPPDGSLLPGDYVAEALSELGEAPALPSEDGLAAQAVPPELTAPEPTQIEPVVPEPVVPEPVAPEAFAAEPASPPVQPSASLATPQIEPPAEPTPGPGPTRPRPSPLSEQPEPEFPVEAILQDLEAQGVVPASAPAPAEEAGSAAELVDQVTTALPDFPAAADSPPPHPAPDPAVIEPSELELPVSEAPAADPAGDPPPPQAWTAAAPHVEPADQIVDAEPPGPAAPEFAPAEWAHEAPQAAMAAEEVWTQDIGVPEAETPETVTPNAMVDGPGVEGIGVEGPGVEDAGDLEAAIPDAAVPDAVVPDAFVPDAVDHATEVPDAGNPEAEGLWAEQGETAKAPEADVPPLPDAVTEAPIPVAAEAGTDLEIPEPPLPVAFEPEAVDLPPATAEPEMTVMEAEIAPDAVWH